MDRVNAKTIAWSNLLSEYYVFADLNSNGIFDAGSSSSSGAASSLPTLMFSDEFKGMLMPYAVDAMIEIESINKSTGQNLAGYPISQNQTIPENLDVDALLNNFTFDWNTPLNTTDGYEFSWSQSLNDYPTFLMLMDPLIMEWHGMETDYEYANKLTIDPTGIVDLETMNTFGEIANATIKAAVENYSLAVPYYSAFLSHKKVNNTVIKGVPRKANNWQFNLEGDLFGEIDFDDPLKENYTLIDYPSAGINTVFPSQGSSVSKIIIDAGESGFGSIMSTQNPFGIMLYG